MIFFYRLELALLSVCISKSSPRVFRVCVLSSELLEFFGRDTSETFGERVTALDHALQTFAYLRARDPTSYELQIAGFWHDIGHSMLGERMEASDGSGTDLGSLTHEATGAEYLSRVFGEKSGSS